MKQEIQSETQKKYMFEDATENAKVGNKQKVKNTNWKGNNKMKIICFFSTSNIISLIVKSSLRLQMVYVV